MRPTGRLATVAVCVVLAAGTGRLLAAPKPGPLDLAPVGPMLAGATATASWEAPGRGAFDEMELVLSLDGGRTWPLRISRDLSPEAAGASFRIPSLPSDEAVVALRAGRKGDRESETIVAESAPFRIGPPASTAGETLRQVRGEWRTHDAMDGQAPDGPSFPGLSGAPAMNRDDRDDTDVEDDDGIDELPLRETGPLTRFRPGSRLVAPAPPPVPNLLLTSRRE